MTMFHIRYPASREYFTWDELGCLCRALGFPASLVKDQIPTTTSDHIGDEHGISVKNLNLMMDMKLLYKHLHRTFNSHTADWNQCVIKRSTFMMAHRVLDFEGLHQVRVAYLTYEHADMKGMLLDTHTLLRTLKMCGRTISPLKLKHRVKHMKSEFEEKGRIQLYEFYLLILWCDLYTSYNPEDNEKSFGKEEELFQLVDFHRLLSHHDERLLKTLDGMYLKEERDFGKEKLGDKHMFTEPVVYTQMRLEQYIQEDESILNPEFLAASRDQSQHQKQNYRQLKQEVGSSQRRVYRAHAGSIRPRPISAPDLDKYRGEEAGGERVTSTAQAAYESVQRRLHSAPSKASSHIYERPTIIQHIRSETPKVITPRDLSDVRRKMETLEFDINTLDSRCRLQIENEMDFYIPGYKEKLANRKPEPEPVPEPERKPLHWTRKIINNLAYPPKQKWPAHAKMCDARLRGWRKGRSRPGYHVIMTSQTFENSEKGRMHSKMEKAMLAPVQYLHPEYVIRYTSESQVEKPKSVASRIRRRIEVEPEEETDAAPLESGVTMDGVDNSEDDLAARIAAEGIARKNLEAVRAKYLDDHEERAVTAESSRRSSERSSPKRSLPKAKKERTFPRGLSAPARMKASEEVQMKKSFGPRSSLSTRAAIESTSTEESGIEYEDVPVPHMEHSGPVLVGVGQIGTIALLESIQESRDLEEKFHEPVKKPGDTEKEEHDSDDNESELSNEEVFDRGIDSKDVRTSSRIRERTPKSSSTTPKTPVGGRQRRLSKSAPSPSHRKLRSQVMKPRSAKTPRSAKREALTKEERQPSREKTCSKSEREINRFTISRGTVQTKEDNYENEDDDEEYDDTTEQTSSDQTSTYYTDSTSPVRVNKFKGFHGSVTSEESDSPPVKTPVTTEAKTSRQESFSEEMTLPSSAELMESPVARNGRLGGENGIDNDRRFSEVQFAPQIQFDLASELGDLSSSDGGMEPHRIYTSLSERNNSIKPSLDYRDYLSDSGLKPVIFSKETRSRLVRRVANVISPDLRMRLLTGDTSVSVPAS